MAENLDETLSRVQNHEINSKANEITLDSVLRRCGDFGRYQWIHYIFLNLIAIVSGINASYYVFGVAEPLFRCRLPSDIWPNDDRYEYVNETHKVLIDTWQSATSKCEWINGSACTEFVYDRSVFGRTITEDGQYICQNAVKGTWLSTAYQIGPCFGIISGTISDKIGRRKVIQALTIGIFVIPVIVQLFLQFLSMTMNTKFALLLLIQFIKSLDAYGISFVLLMELTSSSYRTFVGNSILISYSLGEIIVTFFAYIVRDWLNLKWLTSGYLALTTLYLYFVPESPYWLFSMKKFDQLEINLKKISKMNGHREIVWYPDFKQLIQSSPVTTTDETTSIKTRIVKFGPKLCIGGLIGFVTMLLFIKISYGLALMNGTISPHLSFIVGAIAEAIGYLSANFVMSTRLGRKYALITYALLTSICVLAIPFIPDRHPVITIVVSQLGKLVISGAVSVSWIYVPELFPTSIRALSIAVLVFVGRFGAILAPIVDATLGDRYSKITFYVYAALTILIIALVIPLSETRNRSFEDTEEYLPKTQIENGNNDKYDMDGNKIDTKITSSNKY